MSSAPIPASDRVPLFQKIMFATGENMNFACTGLMTSVLWMPFFNIGLGMKPYILGIILMIYRGWDAITDPIIGNISDNARTRWGRRRPFLVVGAILTATMYPVFWHIPLDLTDQARVTYLIVVGMIYFTVYTVWSMPYYGFQLELTPNYDERTNISAWCTLFGKFGFFIGGWVLAIATSSYFANPETGKPDIIAGMRVISWFIAGCILVVGLLPALFVKERYYQHEVASKPKPRLGFWQSIRESSNCRPLWFLVGAAFCLVLGTGAVSTLGQYLNYYYVNHGDLQAANIISGWKTSVIVVSGIVCIPLWSWLGKRYDKKAVVAAMLLTSLLGHLLNIVCMTPDYPYLQIISGVFESGAISAVWLFIPSMKADAADYDEQLTNRRREGSINAFFSWFVKVAHTCAFFVGGVLLEFTGFTDPKLGDQPPEVLHRMMVIYIALPTFVWGLGLLCLWRYPLNREKMLVIRADLEARRGTV
jgi:GPH family glycoside/pentoside/hexuronide:cation symporter